MKFVDYRGLNGHYQFMLKNGRHKTNVTYVTSEDVRIKNLFLRLLNKLHYNSLVKLPLKSVWFRFYIPKQIKIVNEPLCFVIQPAIIINYGEQFVKYLQTKYKSKVVLVLGDKIATYPSNFDVAHLKTVVDFICTYNILDSNNYKIPLHPSVIYDIPINSEIPFLERLFDVFFIGQEKGRGKEICEIYKKCVGLGLRCDFNIVGETKTEKIDGIHYCNWMPYKTVFEKMKNTKSILNILQPGAYGVTMRDAEAYNLGSFLLTNNDNKELHEIFNNGQIVRLEELNSETANIIKRKQVRYPRKEIQCTIDNFYRWIENALKI